MSDLRYIHDPVLLFLKMEDIRFYILGAFPSDRIPNASEDVNVNFFYSHLLHRAIKNLFAPDDYITHN
jgi:hypothetical protein